MASTTAISVQKSYTLLVSGVGTAALGLFHFFLPRIYGWEADMRRVPAELGWALLALNCFFSALLLLAGLTAVAAWWRTELRVASSLTLATFWCINVAYQLMIPPPWPHTIALGFLALAALVAALSLWGTAASFWQRAQLA
jgi:hypothetical protein